MARLRMEVMVAMMDGLVVLPRVETARGMKVS
jgi:hypothetical protein